jgi:hypothetical protein
VQRAGGSEVGSYRSAIDRPVEPGEQGGDAPRDLVAERSDGVDRPVLGVREVPVDVALARDVGAAVAAPPS